MKILNLYAGIGGNRKLWGDEHEITAVENNKEIAEVYKKLFPKDKVIVKDAHKFLLQHFQEYDFIWSSPPCPSHSMLCFCQKRKKFPDMKLYEEIIFLKTWFKGYLVVENVKSYYDPLIKPKRVGRHYVWSNFKIPYIKVEYQIGTFNRQASEKALEKARLRRAQIPDLIDFHGLKDFKLKNKRQVLRNCVYPKVGLHIFKQILTKSEVKEKEVIQETLDKLPKI